MSSHEENRRTANTDLALAIALFFLAAVVRLIVALRTHAISTDGALGFVPLAQQAAAGNWDAVFRHHQHPLFPLLIYAAHFAVSDWLVAAQAVGIVIGASGVFPLFYLTRAIFGRATAVGASLVFAFHTHSARFAVDVVSEPLFILCLTAAVLFGWRAWKETSSGWSIGAGLAGGLAYLTRPEGVGVFLLCSAWNGGALLTAIVRRRGKEAVVARAFSLLALLAGFALPAVPYITEMHRLTGEWQLTQKKRVRVFLTFTDQPGSELQQTGKPEPKEPLGPPPKPFSSLLRIGEMRELGADYLHTLNAPLALVGAGVFYRRRYRRDPWAERFLFSAFILYFIAHCSVAMSLHYFSHRYALQGATLLFPWAGAGAVGLWRLANRPERGWGKRLATATLLAVAVVLCFNTFKEQRLNRRGEKIVGMWIRKNIGPGARILSLWRDHVALYAEGQPVRAPWLKAEGGKHRFAELLAYMQQVKPDCFLLHRNRIEQIIPDYFAASKEAGWDPVFRCSERGEPANGPEADLWLYKFSWPKR